MLPPRDLAIRLTDRGLLARGALMHDGLLLEDVSRRNSNVIVRRRGRPLFFVKQQTDGSETLDHEARVYRRLTASRELKPLLPRLRHHESGLLVLSAVSGEDLAARALRLGNVATRHAAHLGNAVGALHQSRIVIPGRPSLPWLLFLAAPPIGILTGASAGNLAVLRIAQESVAIGSGLAELARTWRSDAPLHNDLRLENCIVARRGRRPALTLVDWELAAMGDPAWDAGSVIAALAALWLFSLRYVPGMTVDELGGTATIPIATVRPAARAFWDAYAASRRLRGRPGASFRRRAVRCAAARLVQFSWERTQFAKSPGAEVLCALQAAENIFRDPDAASSTLLGIRSGKARRG